MRERHDASFLTAQKRMDRAGHEIGRYEMEVERAQNNGKLLQLGKLEQKIERKDFIEKRGPLVEGLEVL